MSPVNTMNNYESGQELGGENKKSRSKHNRKGISNQRRVKYDHRFRISRRQKQETEQFTEDEYDFQLKKKEMKEKMILVTMEDEKNQKYDEVSQCMKEGMHRVLKLI